MRFKPSFNMLRYQVIVQLLDSGLTDRTLFFRQDLLDYRDLFRPFLMKGRKRHLSSGQKPNPLLITVRG